MLQQEQLEKYLSLCMQSNADFAEIYEEDEISENINVLNDTVESCATSGQSGIGIRLFMNSETVYAFTSDTSEASVLPLIDELRDAFGKVEKEARVVLNEVKYENKHPVKVDFTTTSFKDKLALIKRAKEAAFAYDTHIVKTNITLLNVKQNVQIATSKGRFIKDTRVRTRMGVSAYAKDGDLFNTSGERPGASMGLEFYDDVTPESIGTEAARSAMALLYAEPCPSGVMPVVIDNGFGGVIFHEACGHALEATGVAKGQSVFAGKLGQKIASECVSAVDDGTIANAWGSENIDDEGTFQQNRLLIENGILKSYMIDEKGARRMGCETSGSSRRESYKYEPTSRMSNTFILPGKDSYESLFEGIKFGLYAKKMGGGSVNPATGEFNFAVNEGYLIEDGKVTRPVKGASLIGSGKDILFAIDKVSDNLARAEGMCGSVSGSIPTDVGQPALRVSKITVGGTAA